MSWIPHLEVSTEQKSTVHPAISIDEVYATVGLTACDEFLETFKHALCVVIVSDDAWGKLGRLNMGDDTVLKTFVADAK